MSPAVSTGVAWVYGLAVALVVIAPAAITLLKGQVAAFAVGFLTLGLVWVVAACRLAQPGSWWARRFYDEHRLARARRRYGTG